MRFWIVNGYFLLLLLNNALSAQTSEKQSTGVVPSSVDGIHVSVNYPVGNFLQTHSIGVSAGYERNISLRQKKANFLYGVTTGLHVGQKETVSGYTYTYKPYFYSNAMGGISYQITKQINSSAQAGPGFTVYNQEMRFGFFGKAALQYNFENQFMMGVQYNLIQTFQTRLLGAAGLQFTYLLQ